jgi:putative membrane protein
MSSQAPDAPRRGLPRVGLPGRMAIAWLTNAILLWAVVALLRDASAKDVGALLEAAAVYGVLNTFVKPLLRFITLPLAILSFGVIWYLVSLFMLLLTKDIVHGFHIHGFFTYVLAGLIIWVVNMALDLTPGPWQLTGKRRKRRERDKLLSFLRSGSRH